LLLISVGMAAGGDRLENVNPKLFGILEQRGVTSRELDLSQRDDFDSREMCVLEEAGSP
jgi:hypothetical protein